MTSARFSFNDLGKQYRNYIFIIVCMHSAGEGTGSAGANCASVEIRGQLCGSVTLASLHLSALKILKRGQ